MASKIGNETSLEYLNGPQLALDDMRPFEPYLVIPRDGSQKTVRPFPSALYQEGNYLKKECNCLWTYRKAFADLWEDETFRMNVVERDGISAAPVEPN